MRVALVSVHSHPYCTLKDVAGGYGTAFHIGDSLPARILEKAKSRIAALPPPALGYLARIAKDAGHSVQTLDVHVHAGQAVPDVGADLAIVLTSLVDAPAERDVLAELGSRGIRTMAIGAYATKRPEYFAGAAHTVVLGEAEKLGNALFDPGLGDVVDAGYVDDLDTLPFPDWTPFDASSFRYAFLAFGTTLPIQGSRGCTFGCGYCPFRATSPFRERAPHRIAEEARYLRDLFGAKALAFRDPLFNFHRERVLDIARHLKPLALRFSGEMRADRLDDEVLTALYGAGLRSLELGVESADLELLKREKRTPPSLEQIRAVIATAHRLGIRVIANFMMGLPDDTEDNIAATFDLARSLDTFAVQFTVATPYPGTTLETRTKKTLRVLDPSGHTGWEPTFEHPSLSAARLRELRERAYVRYHYRPRYALRFAKSALGAVLDEPRFALRQWL